MTLASMSLSSHGDKSHCLGEDSSEQKIDAGPEWTLVLLPEEGVTWAGGDGDDEDEDDEDEDEEDEEVEGLI